MKIEKRYAGFHLRLELTAGNETMALLGASGAGKTMTLKCLAGLVKPDKGYIVVDGQVWFDSDKHIFVQPQHRGVGLLFQNYALFPNMTVRQNLLCGLRRDTVRHERETEVKQLMERFCIEELSDRLPSQLSGGQQQRVALARCLARKPKLLLLDEPFAALDTHLRWRLEQELLDTLAAYEGTALYVTHDRDEARRICGRVCVVHQGKSQTPVPVRQWYEKPVTRSAALLAGFENVADVLPGTNGLAAVPDWGATWKCPKPDSTAVAFRVSSAYLSAKPEDFSVACRILRTTEQETICTPEGRPDILLRVDANDAYAAGSAAFISVKPNQLMWLGQEDMACTQPQS